MKKFLVSFCMILALIAMPLTFSACSSQNKNGTDSGTKKTEYYTVKFVTNGGSEISSLLVKDGMIVARPENPTRDGYVFDGWYTNSSYALKYNFNGKVRKDLTLYANWYDADLTFAKLDSGEYVVSSCKLNKDSQDTDTLVEIPSVYKDHKVVGIAGHAFANCTWIENVIIPDSVTEIGENAFYGCTALTEVTIPTKVTEIKTNTFYGCTSLQSVAFNAKLYLKSIGDGAFNGCTSLLGVSSLGQAGFPQSLATIGEMAFNNCSSLETINISSNIAQIGDNAFKNCTGLTEIVLPVLNGISRIAFNGCTNVDTITTYCENSAMIEAFASQLGFTGTLKVYNHVNVDISEVTKQTINTSSLFGFSYVEDSENTLCVLTSYSSFGGNDVVVPSYLGGAKVVKIAADAFSGKNIASIIIPSTVVEIEAGAFENCKNLINVVFSSNCRLVIPENAFKGCIHLSEIAIPANDRINGSIGASAFEGCTELKKVTILNETKISRVEKWAFRNCSNLEVLELQGSASIGWCHELAFSNCRNLKTIICYTEQINTASDAAYGINSIYSAFERIEFSGKMYVWDFLLPQLHETSSSLKYEGIDPNDLFELTILDTGYTVEGCKINAQYITIPSRCGGRQIIGISQNVFVNSLLLKNVALPATITSIGNNAFLNCSSLERISIPSNLATIGENAFNGCYNLTCVNIFSASIYREFNDSESCKLYKNATNILVPKSIVDANTNTYLNDEELFTKTVFGEEGQELVRFTKK